MILFILKEVLKYLVSSKILIVLTQEFEYLSYLLVSKSVILFP